MYTLPAGRYIIIDPFIIDPDYPLTDTKRISWNGYEGLFIDLEPSYDIEVIQDQDGRIIFSDSGALLILPFDAVFESSIYGSDSSYFEITVDDCEVTYEAFVLTIGSLTFEI